MAVVLSCVFSLSLILTCNGQPSEKSGELTEDEIWTGEVFVTDQVMVPEGITLTIRPGTVIRFKHYRGYKEPKRGLAIIGGTIKAIGIPEKQIWFTSDADKPINGDWAGISLVNAQNSEFDYVIVEYGEIGIEQFHSEVNVSNSILRWNNSEGLYAEKSSPVFRNNTIYGNAYHAIALENYNADVEILNNLIYGPRHQGIMVQHTTVYIEGNYFKDFDISGEVPEKVIWIVMDSEATIKNNNFSLTGKGDPIFVEDSIVKAEGNNYSGRYIATPQLDYKGLKTSELGYIIGDPEDKYLYVFDEVDETRRIINRYGKGLGLGWTVAFANGGIWSFCAGGTFVKIDPVTGIDWNDEYANPEHLGPRGLAYDGEYFWANEHGKLKIVKFKLGCKDTYPDVGSGKAIEIVDSFDIPESEHGGGSGIAADREFLYIPSVVDGTKLYKLDKGGRIIDEIHFEGYIGPVITCTEENFWSASGAEIRKWSRNGKLIGAIYAPAVETWDITWDGQYLWTVQRTCENWQDAKIFQVEIIDESKIGITEEIQSEREVHQERTYKPKGGMVIIDAGKTGAPISKYVYGQFIEHQGRCVYGGIWAEMLEDRKFFYPINFYFPWGENKHQSPWKPIGFDTIVFMDRENSYVGEHTPRIELEGEKKRGIMQDGLALQNGKKYEGRVILAGDSSVEVEVSLAWGPRENDRQTVTISSLTKEYKKWPFSFKSGADTNYGRLEIVGKGQGSFNIGTASLMPADNIHGMRADTIKLLKELNATVYRWPGGIFVNDYKWRKAVGERDKRPPRENRIYWSIDVESRDFGPDEFMSLCRVVEAEPYVAVSATSPGDAHMAAAEVEYFNSPANTSMGMLRASNGHPEPYNVKFWGVGNEMWGFMPLEAYIHRHNEIARAMLKADQTIKLIAVGGLGTEEAARERGWPEVEWSEGMLRECCEHMNLISEHIYCGEIEDVVEHVKQMPNAIHGTVNAHRDYRKRLASLKDRDIRLALDEWNYWYGPEIYGEAGIRRYHKDALGMAAGLHEIFRNSDIIFMANPHPVNVHGCIKTTKTSAAAEVQALALQMYRNHFGDLPVAVKGDCEPLDVAAALTGDHNFLTIGIVNPTRQKHLLNMNLRGVLLNGKAQLWQIKNSDPMAYNAPDKPPQVVIEEKQMDSFSNEVNVPPLSINLYELSIR